MIDIIIELKKRNSNYKLLVIGSGSVLDSLIKKAENVGVDKDIYFAGAQYNPYDWYMAMDAFVLPSLYEGLPMVGIEAQASGLPCFLSETITAEVNVSNTIQYISIEHGAILWAEQIINTLEEKMINKVELPENYKIENAVKKLEKKYDELVSK